MYGVGSPVSWPISRAAATRDAAVAFQPEPVFAERLQGGASCHHIHPVSSLGEPRSDEPADRAGSIDANFQVYWSWRKTGYFSIQSTKAETAQKREIPVILLSSATREDNSCSFLDSCSRSVVSLAFSSCSDFRCSSRFF